MNKYYTRKLGNVIEINESQIQDHLGELVCGTVEETLNSILDPEADSLCNAAISKTSYALPRIQPDRVRLW